MPFHKVLKAENLVLSKITQTSYLNPHTLKMKRGFTLIELLVVIAIIGILASFAIASFTSAQVKGRDAKRKADLDAMKIALQMYYNDNQKYPDWRDQSACGGWGARSTSSLANICAAGGGDQWLTADPTFATYIKQVPKDPVNEVSSPSGFYAEDGVLTYTYWSNGTTYDLLARLENDNDPSRCGAVGYYVETMGGRAANVSWCINKTGGSSWWSNASADWLFVVNPP